MHLGYCWKQIYIILLVLCLKKPDRKRSVTILQFSFLFYSEMHMQTAIQFHKKGLC